MPIIVLALGLLIWEMVVRIGDIPPYVLPAPGLILQTLVTDWALLLRSLAITLVTTFEGFLLAAAGGVGLRSSSTSRGWSNIRSIPMR